MARYATILTTGAWDSFIERQVKRTHANVRSGDMFVLANETAGVLDIPARYNKVAVTEETVSRLGLPIRYEQTLFCYNVDYWYAAFFHARPDYDYYVFLDYAVVLDTDVDALIAAALEEEIDFIAEPVAGPLGDWVYAKAHRTLYPPGVLQGAMLPVAVLSRAAVAYLFHRRRQLAKEIEGRGDGIWPFCEAFVPTELTLAGFRTAPLSHYGSVAHFTWWPPILDGTLPAGRQRGFVHPLLDRPRFVATTLKHMPARDLLNPRAGVGILRQAGLKATLAPWVAAVARKGWTAVRRGLPQPRTSSPALRWGRTGPKSQATSRR